jgi:hypothetical protein
MSRYASNARLAQSKREQEVVDDRAGLFTKLPLETCQQENDLTSIFFCTCPVGSFPPPAQEKT